MEDIVINVDKLNKVYKLYEHKRDRLKEALGLAGRRKLYREHYALRDVSLKVQRGETVGIIGTNGSGKSTLLKIITGVLSPTSGKVDIDGRISALLELGAGFNPEFTGIENVYLNGTMTGFSKAEIDERLDKILEFADIGEFAHQQVKTYSSGMFVRLAFAVAINIDPEILIVDEALSVGDVFFQNKCYHKFEEFKSQGKTIIFVSHDLSSINKYCDRVVLLDKGRKLAEGSPKDMIDMYKKVLVHQLDSDRSELIGRKGDGSIGSGDAEVHGAVTELTHKWQERMVLNPAADVYGNGMADIVDFCCIDNSGMITNTIIKGDTFTVRVRVAFNEKVSEPIIALSFKNRLGVEITGTNTMFEKLDTGTPGAGDILNVSFTQDMSLQGGEYLISLGVTGYRDGEFTVYSRMYDIFNITVVSSHDTVGYYDCGSEVVIEKDKA